MGKNPEALTAFDLGKGLVVFFYIVACTLWKLALFQFMMFSQSGHLDMEQMQSLDKIMDL